MRSETIEIAGYDLGRRFFLWEGTMPKRTVEASESETFGKRLARLRKAAGYSQRTLAPEIGISQRMLAYYESRAHRPPAHLLPALAKALGISVDQILGLERISSRKAPQNERLLRQLRLVEKLPSRARHAVLDHIQALIEKYGVAG